MVSADVADKFHVLERALKLARRSSGTDIPNGDIVGSRNRLLASVDWDLGKQVEGVFDAVQFSISPEITRCAAFTARLSASAVALLSMLPRMMKHSRSWS